MVINVPAVASWLYRSAWTVGLPLARLAALGTGKLARTVRGRLRGVADLRNWALTSRDTKRRLVWFHAASVGEGRQAEAVIAEIKRLRPEWQIAYSFSSSSAEKLAASLPVDVAAYLPPDTVADTAAALGALNPSVLVFSATDVWPELVTQAARRGVPVALVSANLGPASSRRGRLARRFLGEAYRALTRVGAIDERDADGLVQLGVPRERITVTGDSRHDAAAARAARSEDRARLLAPLTPHGAPILVAGSTWPGDEAELLPAIATLRRKHHLRLVIAPHEPGSASLARLERTIDRAMGGTAVIRRLSDLEREAGRGDAQTTVAWDICVVDRVGVLFDLYAAGAMAYVGGGFHAAGLHSVIEPASLGVPVIVGPRWHSSRDARLLLEARAAVSAPDRDAITLALRAWLEGETARTAAGAAARAVVDQGLGAAARSAELVIELAERDSARV